ncbi:zinc finger protein 518A [Corythoichthys intestinalis]|uniref:zinc finger protein 518A n=1 Tax=Corythoichthys intestinalis TaxID=161448 RepID=UPI0025A5654A|nr:zinc finger protein 518A [Corythoichthys intestinalis]
MDLVDICTVISATNKKQCTRKNNRVWHKRLRRRNPTASFSTMQRGTQNGPKKMPEEHEQSTEWPSSKKSHLESQQSERWTNHSIDALRFTCCQCKDNLEYVPKDLVRHFEENHRGSSPIFSCHMCPFDAHDFTYLRVHLLSHKDTFSSCNICNDDVKRTWEELSTHLTMCHCQNGKYSCEKCSRFSTEDVTMFLKHMCVHHLGLQRANEIELDKNVTQFGSVTANQTLRCPHCSYEASHNWVLAKHIKANHGCQKGNQKKKETRSKMRNSNHTHIKPRLTRSSVKEMCWLTQDCLSLPGRNFLDKYCHLPDPQTTLEETQQFLMKSVAGEKGDQKWTKALKSVLSNVPQDISVHPKSENGIVSNSEALTVLTVQNKITVAQNGATYPKRLKMVETTEKGSLTPESTAADTHYDIGQNQRQVILNDNPYCLDTETKVSKDVVTRTHNETLEFVKILENGENQESKTNLNNGEDVKNEDVQLGLDGINISGEPMITNESQEQKGTYKAKPKNTTKRRRKRKSRFKKVKKVTSELALKIVLKKNPVKERQWVSQSPLLPVEDHSILPPPDTTVKASIPLTDQHDPKEAITLAHTPSGTERPLHGSTKPAGLKNVPIEQPFVVEDLQFSFERKGDDANKTLQFVETVHDKSILSNLTKTAVEACPESSSGSPNCSASAVDDGGIQSSHSKSPPISEPAITSYGVINPAGKSQIDLHVEVPPKSNPKLFNCSDQPIKKAIRQESWPAFVRSWQPPPKSLQRTLKLNAVNPSQLIKRPVRDQPVVVLNHPDADIPEVARIMNVVSRYKGDVQKVVLSQRTLKALSAVTNGNSETNHYMDAQTQPPWHGESLIQERFVLKLRLRRLSRKKYEVVDAVSSNRVVAKKFSCWFCGRVFEKQELWMVHRQRHLIDWKRPNCENF